MEARRKIPDGAAPNIITEALPDELLKMTLGMLPASHRFVSPVNRKFRDLYYEVMHGDKKKKWKTNFTFMFSISSEVALQQCLDEKDYRGSGDYQTSMIGAGCGRTEWVERGGVFDEYTCAAAAMGGQIRVLKWLRERDCPMYRNEWTCYRAARGGHLEVLQWLREEGCPWDSDTCKEAAANGNFEVLRWAIENGCPYEELYFITDPNFLEWFEWFEQEGIPM